MADTTAVAPCYPSVAMKVLLPLHRLHVIQQGDHRILQSALRPECLPLHPEPGQVFY